MATQPAIEKGTLNLIIHGLFGFVLWDHSIELLAPQIDEHVYLAGNWMQETRLQTGTIYELEGVEDTGILPAGEPEPSSNVIVSGFRDVDRSAQKVYCSFILPLPRDFFSLVCFPNNGNPFFSGADADPSGGPASLALVHILVFEYPDRKKLCLASASYGQNHPWQPTEKKKGIVNLHLWAEPECQFVDPAMAGQHPIIGFRSTVGLFSGLDLHLKNTAQGSPNPDGKLPPGVDAYELENLSERWQMPVPTPQARPPINCDILFVDNRMSAPMMLKAMTKRKKR